MEELLLAALLIGWAAILLPSALRSRRSVDPSVTVGGFAETMAVLRGRPEGREIMVPGQADRLTGGAAGTRGGAAGRGARPSARAALNERRKQLFLRLLGLTGVMLLAGLVFGGMFWALFLVTGLITGGYVGLLRHYKLEREAAREVVREMDIARLSGRSDVARERQPVAVGAESYGGGSSVHGAGGGQVGAGAGVSPGHGVGHAGVGRAGVGPTGGGWQVVNSPDQPWEPQSSVRIRRWDT